VSVSLQREPFDIAAEIDRLRGAGDVGAIVTFTGICREGAGDARIAAMTLDHYPAMAQAELLRIEAEASARWPLLGTRIVHRHGRIEPGEDIVLVVTASAHRQAAFEAASFLMDYLKTRAPFWKKEERGTGDAWVAARGEDEAAAARWAGGRKDEAG
jgi:molybdopterin synthase catalytic subunit